MVEKLKEMAVEAPEALQSRARSGYFGGEVFIERFKETERFASADHDSTELPSVPNSADDALYASTGQTKFDSTEQGSTISPSAHDSGYSTLHTESQRSPPHQSGMATLLEHVPTEKASSIYSTMHLTLSPIEKELFVTQLAQQFCLGLRSSNPVPDAQVDLMSSNMSSLLKYLSRLTSARAGDKTEKTATGAMRQFRK
jgi:hypothetical protein